MLQSEPLTSKWRTGTSARTGGLCLVLCLLSALLLLPAAVAQNPGFTITMEPFSFPAAIQPGGTDATTITLQNNGVSGAVSLTCQVTPQQTPPATSPGCLVSPSSVTPPGGASVTVTTIGSSVANDLYTVMVTGTASGGSNSAQEDISVVPVVPNFTITVQKPVAPSSVPAGNGAEGEISINPAFGYTSPPGGITLSCASITPLVTIPPVCSFSPQGVVITGAGTATSTVTISTFGPITTGAAAHARGFYSALWLPLPMLALAGFGAAMSGKKSRKAWGLLALFVVSAGLLLMPACGNTKATTSTRNGITPANSYTFTIQGVDANGQASSNTGSSTSSPTVTLAVTAPTN